MQTNGGGGIYEHTEIYWKILVKSKNKLTKLKKLCDVQGYIHDNNTGKKFPKVPFVKSVKDLSKIFLDQNSEAVYQYGVKATGNSRNYSPILFPRTFGYRHLIIFNPERIYGKEFYKVIPKEGKDPRIIVSQLNSTFGLLQRELLGVANLGEGGLKFSIRDIELFQIIELDDWHKNKIIGLFSQFINRTILDIPEELDNPIRMKIDSILFSFLDLSESEISEVYSSVKELILIRKTKAESA